jgi:hypothetical protein
MDTVLPEWNVLLIIAHRKGKEREIVKICKREAPFCEKAPQ